MLPLFILEDVSVLVRHDIGIGMGMNIHMSVDPCQILQLRSAQGRNTEEDRHDRKQKLQGYKEWAEDF